MLILILIQCVHTTSVSLFNTSSGTARGASMAFFLSLGKPELHDTNTSSTALVPFPHNSMSHVPGCSAIGDKKLKQWVIGRPDTAEFDIDEQCEYLILGCDGLFDMMDLDKVRRC